MNIEEIMKPYFDKQDEFSKRREAHQMAFESEQKELKNSYLEEINRYEDENKAYGDENKMYRAQNDSYENEMAAVNVRLQRLRENKKQEIEEYVKNAVSDSSDFYAGYGAMIRKDLEQAYLSRERVLENQIIELSAKINNNYLKIAENNKKIGENNIIINDINKKIESVESVKYTGESNDFHKVDAREIIEVKENLRKELFPAKRNLEIQIKQTQLDLDSIMLKLSMFKYTYDENHKVTNGDDFRRLFEESNRLIEAKYGLEAQLKQLEEYLSMTELTEEEAKILLSGLNPVEQREYDRRKSLDNAVQEISSAIEEKTMLPEEVTSDKVEEVKEEPIEEVSNKSIEEFLSNVFDDIIDSAKKLRTINIDGKVLSTKNTDGEYEEISQIDNEEALLPNGEYISQKDINKALDNYYKKNKGKTFRVTGIDKVFEVTRKTVRQIKKKLKESSAIKLVREKKLGIFDIRRVFGKEKADEYNKKVEVESSNIEMPAGAYINLEQFGQNLKHLFAEKSQKWTEKLARHFQPYDYDEEEYAEEEEFEQLEEQKEKTR